MVDNKFNLGETYYIPKRSRYRSVMDILRMTDSLVYVIESDEKVYIVRDEGEAKRLYGKMYCTNKMPTMYSNQIIKGRVVSHPYMLYSFVYDRKNGSINTEYDTTNEVFTVDTNVMEHMTFDDVYIEREDGDVICGYYWDNPIEGGRFVILKEFLRTL